MAAFTFLHFDCRAHRGFWARAMRAGLAASEAVLFVWTGAVLAFGLLVAVGFLS